MRIVIYRHFLRERNCFRCEKQFFPPRETRLEKPLVCTDVYLFVFKTRQINAASITRAGRSTGTYVHHLSSWKFSWKKKKKKSRQTTGWVLSWREWRLWTKSRAPATRPPTRCRYSGWHANPRRRRCVNLHDWKITARLGSGRRRIGFSESSPVKSLGNIRRSASVANELARPDARLSLVHRWNFSIFNVRLSRENENFMQSRGCPTTGAIWFSTKDFLIRE